MRFVTRRKYAEVKGYHLESISVPQPAGYTRKQIDKDKYDKCIWSDSKTATIIRSTQNASLEKIFHTFHPRTDKLNFLAP